MLLSVKKIQKLLATYNHEEKIPGIWQMNRAQLMKVIDDLGFTLDHEKSALVPKTKEKKRVSIQTNKNSDEYYEAKHIGVANRTGKKKDEVIADDRARRIKQGRKPPNRRYFEDPRRFDTGTHRYFRNPDGTLSTISEEDGRPKVFPKFTAAELKAKKDGTLRLNKKGEVLFKIKKKKAVKK